MRKHVISPLRTIAVAAAWIVWLMPASAQHNQDWAGFNRYKEQNTQVSIPPKVVFMGNSITQHWAQQHPDFFREHNYLGRGISGQTSAQMLVRFRQDVIDLSPQKVVIMAGINDIAQNNGYIALENVVSNIVSMCQLAQANGIEPLICSVTPADTIPWRPDIKPAEKIVLLNEMLKNYALQHDIIFVDYYAKMVSPSGGLLPNLTTDGVHLTPDGYRVIEQIILSFNL